MLRSIKNMLGLAQLGYAGVDGLRPFGADIFTNPSGTQLPPVKKPTVSLGFNRSLQPCTSRRFVATANATGRGTRIVMSLDGNGVGSKTGHELSVRIDVKDLKPGRHVVRAKVTDSFGRSATASRSFNRCQPGGTGTGDDDDDD